LTFGGSSTSHIYTQTVHIIQRKGNWEVRAVPCLCELYHGICLATEEKARKNLSKVAQYKNNEAQYKHNDIVTRTMNNKCHRTTKNTEYTTKNTEYTTRTQNTQ
jgi:hypothetical protein